MVSIHTLAWRVTIFGSIGQRNTNSFNPHPRVEGDKYSPLGDYLGDYRFNPHPRVEGDYPEATTIIDRDEFQSTPSRGG